MIQMTLFLMYTSLEGVNLIQKDKKLVGSLLLALAMNIKIVPLVFLPYLIYRKEFKASAYIVVLFIAMLFVPGLFIGFAFNWQMLSDWLVAVDPTSDGRMLGETGLGPVGLSSLIPVMLMDNVGELPLQRNFINLPVETVKIILNCVRLILIIFTLYFLRFPPFKKSLSSKHTVWEMAYLFCIIPLLAPQQQKYAFFFVFPAVLYILYFLFFQYQQKLRMLGKNKFRLIIVLFSLFVALTTLTTDGLVGRKLNLIFQHYRTITYGGLVLVVTLSLCRPEYLQEEKEGNDLS